MRYIIFGFFLGFGSTVIVLKTYFAVRSRFAAKGRVVILPDDVVWKPSTGDRIVGEVWYPDPPVDPISDSDVDTE